MTVTLDQVYRIIQSHTTCEERPLGMSRGITAAAEICRLFDQQNEILEKQEEMIDQFREAQIQAQISMMRNLTSSERNQSIWESYHRNLSLLS